MIGILRARMTGGCGRAREVSADGPHGHDYEFRAVAGQRQSRSDDPGSRPRRAALAALATLRVRLLLAHPPLLDHRGRHAVAVAERQAEGLAESEEIEDAKHIAHAAVLTLWQPGTDPPIYLAAMAAHYTLVRPQRAYLHAALAAGGGQAARAPRQAGLIRDLFGNPYQPVRLDPAWRSPTVLAIAGDIYEHDTFGELPVLADALEDAGCEEPAVLDHARHDCPHVRGCWLVDGLLGKR